MILKRLLILGLFFVSISSAWAAGNGEAVGAWTPCPRLGANSQWWQNLHQRQCAESKAKQPKVLFVGDSITALWMVPGLPVWNHYFANLPSADLGIGGDSTQTVLWRILHGALDGVSPKLVVLMIGTNNLSEFSAEDTARGVAADISAIHTKLPQAKIILLGVLPRTKGGPAMAKKVVKLNGLLSKFPPDRMIYADISLGFLDRHGRVIPGVETDGLHPSQAGYAIMARNLSPIVMKLLSE